MNDRYDRCSGIVKFEPNNDQPEISFTDSSGVWSVLASTEKWISETLSSAGNASGSNPYTRKEVSYVCEIVRDSPMVVATVFRRIREARELGESHSNVQKKAMLADKNSVYKPSTFRQTQIIVIPWCKDILSYHFFDSLLQTITKARRSARDYFTDVSRDKLERVESGQDKDDDWIVSINLAGLHPRFGEKTSKQLLEEMKKEEEDGEVDLNKKEYENQRNRARQSPFPTFVLEVRATPPIDFSSPLPGPPSTQAAFEGSYGANSGGDKDVSKESIGKLEAIFGLPAATRHPTGKQPTDEEDEFHDALSMAFGERELLTTSPMTMSQNWIAANDPFFDLNSSTFTINESKHVDAAYEFVFNNIAMSISSGRRYDNRVSGQVARDAGAFELSFGCRSYLVMPNFVSSSATSFEKFSKEVSRIAECIGLQDILSISTMHPEHVERERRSPHPVFVLQWFDKA